MIYLLLFLFFLVFGLLFIRSVYLSFISAVKIVVTDQSYLDYVVVPVKPNKRFFKDISRGYNSSFVSLGNGYYAFYVDDPNADTTYYNRFSFSSEVYIFKRSKFGRFKSVDLADRCLNDCIKKFVI